MFLVMPSFEIAQVVQVHKRAMTSVTTAKIVKKIDQRHHRSKFKRILHKCPSLCLLPKLHNMANRAKIRLKL